MLTKFIFVTIYTMTEQLADLTEQLEPGIYIDEERNAFVLVPEIAEDRVIQFLATDRHNIAALLQHSGLPEKGSFNAAIKLLKQRQQINTRLEADFAMQQFLGFNPQHVATDHAGGTSPDIRAKLLGIRQV